MFSVLYIFDILCFVYVPEMPSPPAPLPREMGAHHSGAMQLLFLPSCFHLFRREPFQLLFNCQLSIGNHPPVCKKILLCVFHVF